MPTELPPGPTCPECATCQAPPTWQLELALPDSWQAGQRLELVIAPGWDPGFGGLCARVEGRTSEGDETSAPGVLLSSPHCFPVSEPPASALALGGLLAFAALVQVRRNRRHLRPRRVDLEQPLP